MTKAIQSSAMPTRKLITATTVSLAATEIWERAMTDLYPALAGPNTADLFGAAVGLLIAYWVKDRPNVAE